MRRKMILSILVLITIAGSEMTAHAKTIDVPRDVINNDADISEYADEVLAISAELERKNRK